MQQEAERTPMTRHDVLQRIREHFSRPGAVLGYDSYLDKCRYRGDELASSPVRCAIGCLIPDELYNRIYEGQTVFGLLDDERIASLFASDVGESWLTDLQQEHDAVAKNSGSVSMFLAALDYYDAQ